MQSIDEHTSLPLGRVQLTSLIREAGDVIAIDDAVRTLNLSRTDAAKRLARWTEQGWLRRVGQGAYVPVSLDLLASKQVLDDPWILVPALYAPAYVGGRTAAEHWDLTEQIFKDIVVVTGQFVRNRNQIRHGALFTLKHIQSKNIFGTKPVWRHHTKVEVSDLHRTLVDILDTPALGGGIQHVADCVCAYLKRKDRDDRTLIDYALRLGNGAVFKRLGFLAEQEPSGEPLARACLDHVTKGNSKLDPALGAQSLATKWRLWVPSGWNRASHDR
jgi:predicted transcriptional regulator of viral defense system